MAIDDLPGPVVTFLNVIGAPRPYINEDVVHHFATLVREFGQAVSKTHQDATETLEGFAQAYQSSATEQMRSGWAELASNHVHPLVEGAGILADQAASAATFGPAETAVPLIIEAAAKPLFEKIEHALSGLDWSQTAAAAGSGSGLSLDVEEAGQHLSVLRDHAEAMRGHARALSSGLRGLEF